ncbi:hypothetical protein [Carboxylicivirga sp. N1Y90]|uniref:hypothetical protein n=1 Tax=Carboxylicivirga fragile TaxID=3417571 RepID=UPI003D33C0DA|nr:hypothetical protein [Marinilabiliaceae bacterium N1Y90]
MENQFRIEVLAEEGLGLVAKILLYFERKQICVKHMTLDDATGLQECRFNFQVMSDEKEVKSTSLFISKQVGIIDVSFNNLNLAINAG